jgi:hypothetical protein
MAVSKGSLSKFNSCRVSLGVPSISTLFSKHPDGETHTQTPSPAPQSRRRRRRGENKIGMPSHGPNARNASILYKFHNPQSTCPLGPQSLCANSMKSVSRHNITAPRVSSRFHGISGMRGLQRTPCDGSRRVMSSNNHEIPHPSLSGKRRNGFSDW